MRIYAKTSIRLTREKKIELKFNLHKTETTPINTVEPHLTTFPKTNRWKQLYRKNKQIKHKIKEDFKFISFEMIGINITRIINVVDSTVSGI